MDKSKPGDEERRAIRRRMGAVIRARREALGISQGSLAEQIHASQSMMSKYESGDFAPRAEDLAAIAQILHMPVDSLFTLKAEKIASRHEIHRFDPLNWQRQFLKDFPEMDSGRQSLLGGIAKIVTKVYNLKDSVKEAEEYIKYFRLYEMEEYITNLKLGGTD